MNKISLLDCTLRDGGCVNDFAFGIETMGKILRGIEGSGVEYIELGYLDQNKGAMERRTNYRNVEAIHRNHMLDHKRPDARYLAMIDYGKFPAEALPPAKESGVDGIRLCFHKHQAEKAMEVGRMILDLGYRLMVQPMVNTRYTDEEFADLIRRVLERLPELYSIHIVDSFGCMSEEEICHRLQLADSLLPVGVGLGLHTHNNQNLSLTHAFNAIGLSLNRELIIDGTLYGMGKGAGNLPMEKLAQSLNQVSGTSYHVPAMEQVISSIIKPLHRIYDWGFCPEYEISAKYRCTPSYAKLFYREVGCSLDQTEKLIAAIPPGNKDSFNRDVGNQLLAEAEISLPKKGHTQLLDARGYEISMKEVHGIPVTILYMGAVTSQHPGKKYDQDPYVTAHVEKETFTGQYHVVLKDAGITASGLKIKLSAPKDAIVEMCIAGEPQESIIVHGGEETELTLNVSGLCQAERAYLDDIHRILYLLLGEVDRICTKHQLHYYLMFGGLLGVVRHGDIIPWDDDVDIAMPRKDFEKFKRIAPQELGEDFLYLDCREIGGFLDFMCRVMYMKEPVPGNVFRKVEGKCRPDVVNRQPLDIFILDKASDDPEIHARHMRMVQAVYGLGMGHRAYVNKEEYKNRDVKTQRAVKFLSTMGKCIPLPLIYRWHDKICRKYEDQKTTDYFMSNGFLPYIHTRFRQDWYVGEQRMQMGDMQVPVPKDLDSCLKRTYYDYYHLPPVDKRIPEHSPTANGIH